MNEDDQKFSPEPILKTELKSFSVRAAVGQQNLTEYFTDGQLKDISARCVTEFDIDNNNFAERKARIEDLYKLALQTIEAKNYPFENASNIKYPLLTKAALGFAAMAYPAIVKNDRVVKGKVIGSDEGGEELKGVDGKPLVDTDTGKTMRKNAGLKQKIADRVSSFMSIQILETMDGWEDEMDKILHIIPIIGCAFKKTYMDSSDRKPVSKLVLPQYLIINKDAKNVATANRASELIELYPYEIKEMINLGIFRDADYGISQQTQLSNYQDSDGQGSGAVDSDTPHVFIEQHRRIDLDDDGYAEPYIVWIHKQSNEIARIIARFDESDIEGDDKIIRIKSQSYYTDFPFLPDPEGGPYGIGFGHLLQHMNVAINTSINMVINQGHVATMGGGFIGEGIRIKSGNMRFQPNEWKKVSTGGMVLRDNIVPLPIKEPSTVLMSMLQFLIENAEEMSNMNRFMAGDVPANMPATTALATIEQGIQPFKAVFKRTHRALKREFGRLYYINQQYLTQEEYSKVLDDPAANVELDFVSGFVDVVPVSDPDFITDMQSQIRAQLLLEMKDDPLFDGVEVRKRALKLLGIQDIDDLVKVPPQAVDALMQAQQAALQAQIKDLEHQAMMREKEFELKIFEAEAQVKKTGADAIKSIAEAESKEAGNQIELYKTKVEHLSQLKKGLTDGNADRGMPDQGRMGGMENPPDNA